MARPSTFNDKVFTEILSQVSNGKSLVATLKRKDKKYPDYSTFMRWIDRDEKIEDKEHKDSNYKELRKRYARAKDENTDFLAQEIMDISDCQEYTILDLESKLKGFSKEQLLALGRNTVQRDKLRIDTRKWIASKLKAKKYGDRQQIDVKGSLSITNSFSLFSKRKKKLDK